MTGTWPREIETHGIRYQLLAPLTAHRARLRFTGPFEGAEIVWEATLLALGTLPESGERRAYLDIGPSGRAVTPIEIGLDVAGLDEAVLLRTIIMVRQYRRLQRGRMPFGSSLF